MKNSKVTILIILLITLIVFVGLGIYSKRAPSKNETNTVGEQEEEVPQKIKGSTQVLLKATEKNWGSIDASDPETWIKKEYEVYYSGKITSIDTYGGDTIREETENEVSDEDYAELYTALEKEFSKINKGSDATDGTGWEFTFYGENGEVKHEFSGYVYDISVFEKTILPILNLYTTPQ